MSSIKDFTTVISIRPRHAVFVVKRCSSPFTSEDYTLVKFHLRAHHGWMMNLERLQIVEERESGGIEILQSTTKRTKTMWPGEFSTNSD
mmetsp:Transcript_46211/g.144934  ORF Transcript_46211/g.144934 Transcript_46211/m.144934 type:complete len:89 (+) Transcript_46211:307-573(+)